MTNLTIPPISLHSANRCVALHHRHHQPVRDCSAGVAVRDRAGGRGVAILGRPVARRRAAARTADVTPTACSMLDGAAWRAVRRLGYLRLVTYTVPSEPGASLRGAGWALIGEVAGGSWTREARPRIGRHPTVPKLRWERAFA